MKGGLAMQDLHIAWSLHQRRSGQEVQNWIPPEGISHVFMPGITFREWSLASCFF